MIDATPSLELAINFSYRHWSKNRRGPAIDCLRTALATVVTRTLSDVTGDVISRDESGLPPEATALLRAGLRARRVAR